MSLRDRCQSRAPSIRAREPSGAPPTGKDAAGPDPRGVPAARSGLRSQEGESFQYPPCYSIDNSVGFWHLIKGKLSHPDSASESAPCSRAVPQGQQFSFFRILNLFFNTKATQVASSPSPKASSPPSSAGAPGATWMVKLPCPMPTPPEVFLGASIHGSSPLLRTLSGPQWSLVLFFFILCCNVLVFTIFLIHL